MNAVASKKKLCILKIIANSILKPPYSNEAVVTQTYVNAYRKIIQMRSSLVQFNMICGLEVKSS